MSEKKKRGLKGLSWMNQRLMPWWQLGLAVAFGLAAFTFVAWGSTYNFYFSNTEQGNNSTASPAVSINTDKPPTALPSPPPSAVPGAPAAPAQAAATPAPASAVTTAEAKPTENDEKPEFRRWKFTTAFLMDRNFDGGPETRRGGSLGVGFSIVRGVGLNAFAGLSGDHSGDKYWEKPILGMDLEVMPLRLSMGRFEDVFDFGPLVGASTRGAVDGNWVSAHVGARANINLGEQWGLTAAIRANRGYAAGEAGLVVHL